jgi:uracil-DNA glycosylase
VNQLPQFVQVALKQAHPSWHPVLLEGLHEMALQFPDYLPSLEHAQYLPTEHRLFAAFAKPKQDVRYILVGEGPYPRAESATGFSFMDGAVNEIWSSEPGAGLSKKVNRATSLRNFIKMLLVADGKLDADQTGIAAMAEFAAKARRPDSGIIATLADLQNNLLQCGFLLLNASLVFREDVAPQKDAKAWQPMLRAILRAFVQEPAIDAVRRPQLVLWGKIAEQIRALPEGARFVTLESEHPYNLSFIRNAKMQDFFRSLNLLQRLD